MVKMDFLDYINEAERQPPRPERRLLRDRISLLNEFDDTDLLDRFLMNKHNSAEISCLLQTKLSCDSVRGTTVPPSLQVLITLRFLACGTFHHETVDLCGVSESTVCKIVHKVFKAICELIKDYIKFPDAVDQTTYKVQFCEYGNFPGVIGCIGGCHISIMYPSTEDSKLCGNRKNWFSINVQSVCTPTVQIFQNSVLCAQFEAGQHSGILLGDSVRPEQQCYSQAHIHTRGLVERMFGIWKNCFYCLRSALHFEPRTCCIVIVAMAVLYDYLRQHGCPDSLTEYCNDPHVPMAEVVNNKTIHTYRDTSALK
uniref:DDE Tnp4 domain-containing protein n=1 Tax=Amphiprion percula TaxID=161767 RepID=A0A3P8SPB0_AMPPE